MNNRIAAAILALAAVVAAPAHADGYLSGYRSGGTQYCCGNARYLSDYGYGNYWPGSRAGYVSRYTSSVSTPISRPHRADWERHLRNRWNAEADAEGNNGPISRWTRYAAGWYNPMGIPLGLPAGSRYICGTYNRAPAACHARTATYTPVAEYE